METTCKNCVHFGKELAPDSIFHECQILATPTIAEMSCPNFKKKRIKFSPSGLSKYRRCQRAYGLEYVEGFRPPSSTKQNYGKSVHKCLEQWLTTGAVPDSSPEGETAKQGLLHLPPPGTAVIVEQELTFEWRPEFDFGGTPDLIVLDPAIWVYDHKTTSDLKYAKTAEQLKVDEQAQLYCLAVMLKYDVPLVNGRWIYYAATNPTNGRRRPRGCLKVDVGFDARDPWFQDQIAKVDRDFMAMYSILTNKTPGNELPPSPESCGMYGGCEHKFAGRCANLSNEDIFMSAMRADEFFEAKKKIS